MSGDRGWQRTLSVWNDRYRAENPSAATVFETPARVLMVTNPDERGIFRAKWIGIGPPDFVGWIGARPVCFDAKHTDQGRWSFGDLILHQAQDLESCQLAGGVAFVALRLGLDGYVLPWDRLGPLWWAWNDRKTARAVKASISGAEVRAIGRKMPTPGDWLSAIR